VVKELIKTLPHNKIIYFGDTARLPYGTKGADFVKRYSVKITEWLLNRGADVIVIACHTSSACAGDYLKKRFKNIPFFDMITPCAKELFLYKNIGIIGTPRTIKSKVWERYILQINPTAKIKPKACPLFVPLVEEGWIDNNTTKEMTKEYLKEFNNIEALVLACTHYPILEKMIKKTIKAEIINPAKSLSRELKLFLKDNNIMIEKGKHEFFFSDTPYHLNKISKLCLKQKIKPIINDPF